MRTTLAVLALLAPLTLAACGGDDGPTTAIDPGSSDDSSSGGGPAGSPMPADVPAADGLVATRMTATVMDTGRPELCLGAVAESWPPQCGGPPILGWTWSERDGMFERQGDIRWGDFHVTGRWDGEAFTLEDAVPAALYDAMVPEPEPTPDPAVDLSEKELAAIAEEVGGGLAGAQGAYSMDGHVFVDVTYDDGSLQAWCEAEYGQDVVLVTSALVDVT
ncbi:hypothetical protein ACFP3Q_14850 [Nocardioides sp. GCM10027113]|uniref:hypothetical protein n=1 Tax=unclassified Nocardioides TaxID=2615069 RepID=UPI0036142DE4